MRWRHLARFACGCAISALAGGTAPAQESPEIPAKPFTAAQPATAAQTQFYKGKGPGHDNSYLERFEEDWSYLRQPGASTDFFDPLKFIPFDPLGDVYLTLDGEVRFRYDNTDHKNFGLATGGTPSKTPGRLPALTPAVGVSTNELYKQRYALGGDLHLGENLRFYADLYHGQETGHDVGTPIPGNLRDDLSFVNAFGEVYGVLDGAKTGLRAGRQEVYFGNELQVRANVSTNLPSPVFDGFRAYRDWGPARIDAFAYHLVSFQNGVFRDRDIARVNLWGLYASVDLPKPAFAPADTRITLEPFYLGFRSSPNAGGKGGGYYDDQALLTGARIVAATGAGFMSSHDRRDTFGLRAHGDLGNVDYDWQGAYQTGGYAGFRVEAFAVNTDTGYTFHDIPWKPRLGIHLDGASGGGAKNGGTLQTYQPMFPNTQYYAPNNEFAPTNFYDVAPRLGFKPAEGVTVEYYYSFLWRYAESDAIYTGAPWPGGQGQNNFAITAVIPGRLIGRQSDLRVLWTITPHVLVLAEFGVFFPGTALREAGGRITTYLDANLTFKF